MKIIVSLAVLTFAYASSARAAGTAC